MKFQQRLLYATILGNLLAEQIRLSYQKEHFPHLIIPVPLHKKRLRQRGFNQVMEIARSINKKLNISQVSRYAPEEFRPSCPRNSFA
ncbi:ComF family protein [Rickettsiella endosymbiont of Dermanyssus gallinae]|uniref:ComF family protein n=1 Tax=Rickettsiella endosymbiont of Dermanyssus gallinae TaxID=2856608 RepID=UPI001C52C07A|nr:hypothetical protein [Rickettsiella endosymbiont of Dermanyssus gallinae]